MARRSDEKRTDYTVPLAVGAIVAGVVFLGPAIMDGLSALWFGSGGSTRRVKFDKERTQWILVSVNSDGTYEKVPDPWDPAQLADELYGAMSGVAIPALWGETPRSLAWKHASRMGTERLKWLHNYWLDNRDSKDTVWRWLNQETVTDGSTEADWYRTFEQKLRQAGVAF